MTFLKRLGEALATTAIEIFHSKKSMMFVTTVIATIAAKRGWDVDTDTINHYLVLAGFLILGQGIADHGKGAEEERTRQKELGLPTGGPGGQLVQNIVAPASSIEQTASPSP